MRRVPSSDLSRIAQLKRSQIDFLRYGGRLVSRNGYEIEELVEKICSDRMRLSGHWLNVVHKELSGDEPDYRLVVGRAYYAMYHAARVAAFFYHGGDDHNDHTSLPSKLPNDFPNKDTWENALKDARTSRNDADYDPYPRNHKAFKATAIEVSSVAETFLGAVKVYLKRKGCRV